MKIRSAIMISGALALMLVSGCQSSPEPESTPSRRPDSQAQWKPASRNTPPT